MALINTLQSDILENLGRFGYLTVSQFQRITGRSPGYIREMLSNLRSKGYVRSFRIEVSHKIRSENMYVNTALATEFLQSHKNSVVADIKPMTTQVVVKDFFHRFNTVNVNLSLYHHFTACNIPIRTMVSYFDKTGKPQKGTLTARTTIPLQGESKYIVDSIFKTDKGLYLIEMYCDKNTQRIITQLATHAKGIALGTPAKTFDITVNPFVLSVFAHAGIHHAVVKRLQENKSFEPAMAKLFFFATLDDVKQDISTAFTTIHNTPLLIT